MNTIFVYKRYAKSEEQAKEWRAHLEKILDNFKNQTLQMYDDFQEISVHFHNEIAPLTDNSAAPSDFVYEGWTFGVSVGKYPKRRSASNA